MRVRAVIPPGVSPMPRTHELLRLGRLFKMLSRIEGAGDAVRILLLLGFLCLTVHFLACGLFALFAMDDGVWFLTQTDRDYGEVRNGRSKPAAPPLAESPVLYRRPSHPCSSLAGAHAQLSPARRTRRSYRSI